jgi:hypothetical protein
MGHENVRLDPDIIASLDGFLSRCAGQNLFGQGHTSALKIPELEGIGNSEDDTSRNHLTMRE